MRIESRTKLLSIILASLVVGTMFVHPARSQDTEDTEWNCKNGEETWLECFGRLREEAAPEVKVVVTNETSQAMEERSQSFLTGTGVSALGNATAKRGFLPGLFSALGVDGVTDRDGSLVLTYNSRSFKNGTHLSGEFLLNQAAVFDKFAMEIPEDDREAAVEALKGQLTDFDDVSFNFVLDTSGWTGWKGRVGRFVGDYDEEIGTPLFKEAVKKSEKAHSIAFTAIKEATALLGVFAGKTVDIKDPQAPDLDTKLKRAAQESIDYSATFSDTLKKYDYFKLADLAAKQPQLYFTLEGKARDKIVGPNSVMLSATYEHPIGASLNRLRTYCQQEAAKSDKKTDCTLERFSKYVKDNKASIESKDRWRLDVSLGQERPYDFSIPDPAVSLHLDKVNMVEATLAYGRSLIRDREGKDLSRFDFEAKYEDTTGDDDRNNRLVATATLTEKLTDDMAFALSAVWANDPKYRGQVDKAWSARAGLRYKIDRKEK